MELTAKAVFFYATMCKKILDTLHRYAYYEEERKGGWN